MRERDIRFVVISFFSHGMLCELLLLICTVPIIDLLIIDLSIVFRRELL